MNTEKRKSIRNSANLIISILLIWLYLPALIAYTTGGNGSNIRSDLDRIKNRINIDIPYWLLLVYFLHVDRYFRCLFYFRIGPIWSFFISWIRPGDKHLLFSRVMEIGKGCMVTHAYSTILNAESIGDNFSCIHATTIGDSYGKRPILGNNVSLCANVTIIGGVHIGDNVLIGAGSVVVKDIPSNSVVAGNPAKVIKKLS